MHFFALATAAASVVSAVSAATILVKVGENGGLTFNPTNVQAAVGDQIAFQFLSKNHSVTQSTFATPCAIMTTPVQGIDSGFQAVAADAAQIPEWSFTVNNATAPLWFFCAQAPHCSKGMVFSVNAATTGDRTFAAYQALAMGGTASGAGGASASGAAATAGGAVAGASGTPSNAPSGALITRASSAGIVAVAAGVVAGLLL
ncbi:hypothetical protein C8R43DRAFT_1129957 [Mycena crocata]|nr:hypothetical protein C8R43DRAFT_1129957 [Mycena crocata]